ncbi:Aste57867_12988 [Aphanomyces stellatus]|uniref:Aste57867_12988 protein n=1 Tax=Aphanomyces stellatus TaxID=120398 RepID=A0A485KX15_9STRA|nr:hypothetical protein As57867_012940 [Aphanomyces stellatus]VFT89834.1 Aste57867_12988 [Aphanomyces stellatus]
MVIQLLRCVRLIFLLALAGATMDDSSECQQCGASQKCDLAFEGTTPGVYCGQWTSPANLEAPPLPCCCPIGAHCDVSLFYCRCYSHALESRSFFTDDAVNLVEVALVGIVLGVLCLFATTLATVYGMYRWCCHPTDSVAISINDLNDLDDGGTDS